MAARVVEYSRGLFNYREVTQENGDIARYRNGLLHCDDGRPAVEKAPRLPGSLRGTRKWYLYGKLQRTDQYGICQGPAIERENGDREWYFDSVLHCTKGAAIERVNGTREHYLYGSRHCTNGPAIELPDGTQEWFCDNVHHRIGGAAVMRPVRDASGSIIGVYLEWWVNGSLNNEYGAAIIRPLADVIPTPLIWSGYGGTAYNRDKQWREYWRFGYRYRTFHDYICANRAAWRVIAHQLCLGRADPASPLSWFDANIIRMIAYAYFA
jgi:hypothetical protein